MSKGNNLTDFLTDVANAIRNKKGSTATINPQNFSAEIRSIQGDIKSTYYELSEGDSVSWNTLDIERFLCIFPSEEAGASMTTSVTIEGLGTQVFSGLCPTIVYLDDISNYFICYIIERRSGGIIHQYDTYNEDLIITIKQTDSSGYYIFGVIEK